MKELEIVGFFIIFFGVVNVIRMTFFLLGADIYSLKSHFKRNKKEKIYPDFTVVIPAHNEANTVLRSVKSVFESDYPKEKLEAIVVDDGSEDNTLGILREYKKLSKIKNLTIVSQERCGKANALNHAIKKYAKGELVMCLDADSYLDKDAISIATGYFDDKKVMALASNVKIIPNSGLLNLIQRFEYIICYQMKRAHTVFNIEYIIGGIGSTFRRSILDKVNYYDTNTVTEDIDLTMKIIRNGNKSYKAIYGANVISHTEACLSISALLSQRYRWKYGRSQTFFKNKNMFFRRGGGHSKLLTHFYLPFAIYSDFAFFFEPLVVGFILFLLIYYGDTITLLSAFGVITSYICFNIIAENTLTASEKIKLLLIAPTMYIFFYILSFVEYVALIRSIINVSKIKKSVGDKISYWSHVKRPLNPVSAY